MGEGTGESVTAPAASRDLAELLGLATAAGEAAGAELLARFHDVPPGAGVPTKSSATDPVTEADRAVETLLVEHPLPRDRTTGCSARTERSASANRWSGRCAPARTWSGSSPPVLACCQSCWWRPASRPIGCARWPS